MEKAHVLVVDDKDSMRGLFERILGEHHTVTTASDGLGAIEALARESFDVVLTDIRMPGADGFEVLRAARRTAPGTEVILMTAYASIPKAVEAIKEGAYDYLPKPFEPDDVSLVVARAIEHRRRQLSERGQPAGPFTDLPYARAVELAREGASREYLSALLREFKGNVTRAAARAGMERESLHRLLKRYGLKSEDFKGQEG